MRARLGLDSRYADVPRFVAQEPANRFAGLATDIGDSGAQRNLAGVCPRQFFAEWQALPELRLRAGPSSIR